MKNDLKMTKLGNAIGLNFIFDLLFSNIFF